MNIFKKLFPAAQQENAQDFLPQEKDQTHKAYFASLLRSINEPVIDGVQMPGFPPTLIQSGFVGTAGESALREGFRFHRVIRKYCKDTGIPFNENTRILDFGCGWGRMARLFFNTVASENIWGVDVDPDIIDFCSQNMHHGNYKAIPSLPPMDFEDNSFDVIFAYSVFSHLAEHAAMGWIKEFSRILKPGGIAVLTTQGRDFLDFCESKQGAVHEKPWHNTLAETFIPIDKAKADYDSGKFLFQSHAKFDNNVIRNSSYYGEALIPLEYIKREYTPYLNLVEFVKEHTLIKDPVQAKLPQALFVMQKPKA